MRTERRSTLLLIGAAAALLSWSGTQAHGQLKASASNKPHQDHHDVCGSEAQSPGGCFTHWCQSHPIRPKPLTPTTNQPWVVCYVSPQEDGGIVVHQGGVAWRGWERGNLGEATLHDFWSRDYRRDRERKSCGVNCTRYGQAWRIKGKPHCYRVKENWQTGLTEDLPSNTALPKDGWIHRAYCMRPILTR